VVEVPALRAPGDEAPPVEVEVPEETPLDQGVPRTVAEPGCGMTVAGEPEVPVEGGPASVVRRLELEILTEAGALEAPVEAGVLEAPVEAGVLEAPVEAGVLEAPVEAGAPASGPSRPAQHRRLRSTAGDRPVVIRWCPSALPSCESAAVAPEVLRERGLALEAAGRRESAERLFRQAAQGGDLLALGRLAALRSGGGVTRLVDEAADHMYEQAAAEGNTAVLFGLAAAGHARALRLLARLKEEAGQDVCGRP
jgi:hypothetical protein